MSRVFRVPFERRGLVGDVILTDLRARDPDQLARVLDLMTRTIGADGAAGAS